MAYSYITSQRRAALIPQDANLSPEDETSVRIRTGNAAFPLSGGQLPNQFQELNGKAKDGSTSLLRSEPSQLIHDEQIDASIRGSKRKASASIEQQRRSKVNIDCTDHLARSNFSGSNDGNSSTAFLPGRNEHNSCNASSVEKKVEQRFRSIDHQQEMEDSREDAIAAGCRSLSISDISPRGSVSGLRSS